MEYDPGVCNIGVEEQRKRYALGAVAGTVTLAFVLYGFTADLPAWTFLVIAVPLFGAVEGYLQARLGFCVWYAARGLRDGDDGRVTVRSEADRKADRSRAKRIHRYSAAAAVTGAVIVAGVASLV